jgi:prolipoprotein diacylglyceryltransferase
MEQVLFWIPIKTAMTPNGIPVYGFGTMLFVVFVVTTWLAGRRAARVGVPRERIQDLVLWIFLGGLVGARLFYLYQYRQQISDPFLEFFQIWKGGIVFYGSALGGLIAALIGRRVFLKPFNISVWQLADVLAPSIAIGLCLGRIGCFLNGCCYGHVAAPECAAVHFPLTTAPARDLLREYQTSAGFAMDQRAKDDRTVGAIEPNSPAERAGLAPGDVIVAIEGQPIAGYPELVAALTSPGWMLGKKDVTLTVRRGSSDVTLPAFVPRTLGLVPTQLYESVSMFLIFLVLIFLYPLRCYDGQLMVVLMLCYAVHRFFNESLRHDTPTYWFGLTVSQWISIGIFAAGATLGLARRRHPLVPLAARPAAKAPVAQSA